MARSFDRARIGDIDIAYRLEGRGPALVLIHGLACGRRMWARQVRALAGRFTVLTYDQRGHGHSGVPERPEDASPGHLARDLVGLLDRLDIRRCHLVGFSLGGGPALALAMRQPERVAGLVLADVGAGAENPMAVQALARRWVALGRAKGMEALAEDMLLSELFKAYAGLSPRARRHMRALILTTPPRGLELTLSEVLAKRTSLFRMTGPLRAIRVPTLVVAGERDYVCRKSSALLAATIPGAREARIPGAGHMAPLEAPDAFNRLVADFLGAVDQGLAPA